MLRNLRLRVSNPSRVVVLGASGFIGQAIARRLAKSATSKVLLGSKELDLLSPDAHHVLGQILRPQDALVVISARAPCKTPKMLVENIQMMEAVCSSLDEHPVDHVVYISSDAVYADGPVPLTEATPKAPTTLHGIMHLARELMLAAVVKETALAILRPTLVYGPGDPHNGYGPNRFRRLANRGEPIILFGQGEERRDHVHVDDVAEIVNLVLAHRSAGELNVATGEAVSFRDVAELVVAAMGKRVMIGTSPRTGPMPHNGYRPFDASATLAAFPGFRYMPLKLGLERTHAEESTNPLPS